MAKSSGIEREIRIEGNITKRNSKAAFDIKPAPGVQDDEIQSDPGSARAQTAVSKEEIAKRAFALFEARGREHGHDLDDWLQAERELEGIDLA
jgi:Protein of unknown function (DUF2934)